jgi:hypothetical protein
MIPEEEARLRAFLSSDPSTAKLPMGAVIRRLPLAHPYLPISLEELEDQPSVNRPTHLEGEGKDKDSTSRGTIPQNTGDQLMYHYLLAKEAYDRKDYTEVRQQLRHIGLAVRRGELSPDSAATIGNAALLAESIKDTTTALELHGAAHQADPTHWNATQNFLDFIIEKRLAEYFDQAQQMLAELQDLGKNYNPFRTSVLALRYASVAGGSTSETIRETVDSFLQELSADPTATKLTQLFTLGEDLLSPDQADRACRVVCVGSLDDEQCLKSNSTARHRMTPS